MSDKGETMIDLYFWPTPNGYKVSIMLEEIGFAYNVIPINISKGDQFKPEFLEISPNNKMPAIVDHEGPGGRKVFAVRVGRDPAVSRGEERQADAGRDAGALPRNRVADVPDGRHRADARPGSSFPPLRAGEDPVRDRSLHQRGAAAVQRARQAAWPQIEYVAGEYSIADIAIYPWLIPHKWQGQALEDFPNVKRWYDAIAARPAVQRGVAVLADRLTRAPIDEKTREVLFGKQQYEKH